MNVQQLPWRHAVPAAQCYWSVLDATLQKSQLPYRFEAELPLSVDELYVSAVKIANGSWAVCGMPRQEIDAFIQSDPAHASLWSIGPAAFPDFVSEHLTTDEQSEGLLLQLNICDQYPLTTPKRRWQMISLGILVVAVVLAACIGFYAASERQHQADVFVEQQRIAELQALQAVFPDQAHNRAAAYTALTSAMRRLEQQRGDEQGASQDYVRLSHALMAAWPTEKTYAISSINFQGTRLSIRGHGDDMDAAQALWQAVQHISADEQVWIAAPLQAQQQEQRVLFEIHLSPQAQVGR